MPQNSIWGSLTTARFSHVPSLWFQLLFTSVRQLMGVGFPLKSRKSTEWRMQETSETPGRALPRAPWPT